MTDLLEELIIVEVRVVLVGDRLEVPQIERTRVREELVLGPQLCSTIYNHREDGNLGEMKWVKMETRTGLHFEREVKGALLEGHKLPGRRSRTFGGDGDSAATRGRVTDVQKEKAHVLLVHRIPGLLKRGNSLLVVAPINTHENTVEEGEPAEQGHEIH